MSKVEITQEEYNQISKEASSVWFHYRNMANGMNVEREDFIQDICLKVVAARANGNDYTGRNGAAFATWLYRLAHNHMLNLKKAHTAKRRAHNRTHVDDDKYEAVIEGMVQPTEYPFNCLDSMETPSLEDQIIAEEMLERYKQHLKENFAEGHYEAVDLLMRGYKYEEIAEALDIPVGTCRSKLHRSKYDKRHLWDDEDA